MDKAGREGKPWISGLYDYRVTPQSGSIVSPLQLITQCTPREKDLPAQAEYYMGTSNSCKSMCSELLLDHAREWHRTAKSIQAHQDHAKDQIYSNRSQIDRVHERPVDRIKES